MTTLGSDSSINFPKKRYFRQRAHVNPLSDNNYEVPSHPKQFCIEKLYEQYFKSNDNESKKIEFLDIGCGYGGLLFSISSMFPDVLMLGMEIRKKVSEYGQKKIQSYQANDTHKNIAIIRTNAMKHLPNYFTKGQLTKMFILFPDPHFKKRKSKWRIVSQSLLDEYAFFLSNDAIVYTISDVESVHKWITCEFTKHPLFRLASDSELENDYIAQNLHILTDEGKNVAREGGKTYKAIYIRIRNSSETSSSSQLLYR